MSEHQDFILSSDRHAQPRERKIPVKLKLHICLFAEEEKFISAVKQSLSEETYRLTTIDKIESLITLVEDREEKIDCLLLTDRPKNLAILAKLQKLGILLPIAIASYDRDLALENTTLYHPAEVRFSFNRAEQISNQINLALTQFLNLTPHSSLDRKPTEETAEDSAEDSNCLTWQQRRLTEKLKERLGYLGVYYKRNSQDFYRNLKQAEQKKLIKQLGAEYRKIILNYFEDEPNINQSIDRFVHLAFFSDISVSQILEIHMELMDEFAQQLKLEGRNEDILLDYRLALIDIVAHLCEMYRRSIPREDVSLDVFFPVD